MLLDTHQRAAGAGRPARPSRLPDGAIDLVFDLTARRSQDASRLVGTMTRPLLLPRAAVVDFLGVRFRPGRAAAFLRVDASELTDRLIELSQLWGRGGVRLAERLAARRGPRARIRLLERELVGRLARADRPDPYVDAVVEEALRRRGALDLREMERRTGVSGAWLRRGFKRHVGTGPKFFCRVVRLQAVLARVQRDGRACWADVAADHDFADQAHLVREFGALAGLSPTRLLDEDSRR